MSQILLKNLPENKNKTKEELLNDWMKKYGHEILKESLTKLKIDLNKLSKKDLEVMSVDDLFNEKKKVKNELKNYDSTF